MESKEFKNLIESIVHARPMSLEEEYQQKLNEAQSLNLDLIDLLELICEEYDINLLDYLEEESEVMANQRERSEKSDDPTRNRAGRKAINKAAWAAKKAKEEKNRKENKS
jgi:hypothetical protein